MKVPSNIIAQAVVQATANEVSERLGVNVAPIELRPPPEVREVIANIIAGPPDDVIDNYLHVVSSAIFVIHGIPMVAIGFVSHDDPKYCEFHVTSIDGPAVFYPFNSGEMMGLESQTEATPEQWQGALTTAVERSCLLPIANQSGQKMREFLRQTLEKGKRPVPNYLFEG